MSSPFGRSPVTDVQRTKFDQHNLKVVISVMVALLVFAYLCTDLSLVLGIAGPSRLFDVIGIPTEWIPFDAGALPTRLRLPAQGEIGMYSRSAPNADHNLLIVIGIVAGAFLSTYFLPVRHKRKSLMLCYVVALLWLVGPQVTAGFVAAHLAQFLIYHPRTSRYPASAALLGLLVALASLSSSSSLLLKLGLIPVVATATYLTYLLGVRPLVLPATAVARILRRIASQSALIVVACGAIWGTLSGQPTELGLSVMLFFFHWQRSMMYHTDHADGKIPEALPLNEYLAVFFNPASLLAFSWIPYLGQGYSYTNDCYLRREKNRIVISGLAFIGTGILCLLAFQFVVKLMNPQEGMLPIKVLPNIYTLFGYMENGTRLSAPTVLLTTMLSLVSWLLMWASVTRTKIGLSKLLGYDFDAHFQQPWKSTNLTTLWGRFAFHYKEFLVKEFYYPVLFRLRWAKRYPTLRKYLAIFAAATVGNLIWGHALPRMYWDGLEVESALQLLPRWPYYALLGLGIALTDSYLGLRKKRRRPWTKGWRVSLDVIAVCATVQFFALIHVFNRPLPTTTQADMWKLFLMGFGIQID